MFIIKHFSGASTVLGILFNLKQQALDSYGYGSHFINEQTGMCFRREVTERKKRQWNL